MIMASKQDHGADRSFGGPGSSHQREDRTLARAHKRPADGEPTNDDRSHVSGGGGEHDRHHTHDPNTKR